ncbi:MAG: SDR family NAD(P)-dependent oxidoreductase [Gammaproteobacteria bacterium]|nr:SDR family NAD(P)-dependent oxidoreductase [Gammaproteobacteria bacterium]
MEPRTLEGKTCLVTGGTDGIGLAAARELARAGAAVTIVDRNTAKAAEVVAGIIEDTGNPAVTYLLADLSLQDDVRRLAEQVKRQTLKLEILVNNTGVVLLSDRRSVGGIEMTFAVNHLGSFLLTTLLLDLLKVSAPAQIVNVSSGYHNTCGNFRLEDLPRPGRSGGHRAYARSKLCNILFTYELARRLEGSGVTVNAANPGVVRTRILSQNNGLLGRVIDFFVRPLGVNPSKGAETLNYLAASPEVEGLSGRYYEDCRAVPSSALSYDTRLASDLWALSERLTVTDSHTDKQALK